MHKSLTDNQASDRLPLFRFADEESQHRAIRNWLAYIHSCGVSYWAPYGVYYMIMRFDYVVLDHLYNN